MLFNPGPTKPAHEVIFSKKEITQTRPIISLNNIQVKRVPYKNT